MSPEMARSGPYALMLPSVLLEARFVTGAKRERNNHDDQNGDCDVIGNGHPFPRRLDPTPEN
jgi:hypothetical protein